MRSLLSLALAAFVSLDVAAFEVCVVLEPGFDMLVSENDGSVTSDDQLRGYNVDVRKLILGKVGVAYSVRLVESWSALHVYTRTGECDIGWAAFYLSGTRDRCIPNNQTCRPESEIADSADLSPFQCCTDFSVQYFPWSLAIMTPASRTSTTTSFAPAIAQVMLKTFFYNFICFLFIVMVIFGHLVWFVERGVNSKHFPPNYFSGIDDGIWWAIVTATTVGYGDLVPITAAGRLIAMVYMLVGLSLFSILSGFIASEFVSARITSEGVGSVDSLAGSRVCGYPSVLASNLFTGVAFSPVDGGLMEDCGSMLERGEVDVIVWDVPTMLYWRSHDEWAMQANLKIGKPLNDQLVGLAVREGGFAVPDLAAIQSELIDFRSSRTVDELTDKWFPKIMADNQASEESPDWAVIGLANTLVALYCALQVFLHIRRRASPLAFLPAMKKIVAPPVLAPLDPAPSPPASYEPTAASCGRLSHLEAKLVACLREEMKYALGAALEEDDDSTVLVV
jgi:ABC-type amino acid transport substrate-binding protein